MEIDYYQLGQRVRKYRRARDWSQEQLAEKVFISVPHMSHIETGNTKLSLQVFVDLARALEVSADDLLGNNETGCKIAVSELASLLDSCTPEQAHVISEVAKSTKAALERYYIE